MKRKFLVLPIIDEGFALVCDLKVFYDMEISFA